VHLQHAKADLSEATGTLRLTCPKGCRLGDDHAKLVPTRRSSVFVGDGLDFGHIGFDSFEIVVAFDHGTATITNWSVVSADVQLVASGRVKLGPTRGDSVADLCVRFGATPALGASMIIASPVGRVPSGFKKTLRGVIDALLPRRVDPDNATSARWVARRRAP
jgi:hypothetical protein